MGFITPGELESSASPVPTDLETAVLYDSPDAPAMMDIG